jgi:hypothetical protein
VSDIREAALLRRRDALRKELQLQVRGMARSINRHARNSGSVILLEMDSWRMQRIAQVLRQLASVHEKLARLRDAMTAKTSVRRAT